MPQAKSLDLKAKARPGVFLEWWLSEIRAKNTWDAAKNPVNNGINYYKLYYKPQPGNSAGDLFGMVRWPFKGLSDLQLESKGYFESPGTGEFTGVLKRQHYVCVCVVAM